MAITRRTMAEVKHTRALINALVLRAEAPLIAAWADAWDRLADQWERSAALLVSASPWPTQAQIMRTEHIWNALEETGRILEELSTLTGHQITSALPRLTQTTIDAQRIIAATQYPPAAGAVSSIAASLPVVNPVAIEQILIRSTQRITSSRMLLSPEATSRMHSILVRGVAVGDNPRVAARQLVKNLEQGFNGGLTRAMGITRTEMLDVYRAAAQVQEEAMSEVLQDWMWLATLDARTCPSCLSMHGSRHPLREPGPQDHQQGRCARLPRTKSWSELGYPELQEPADLMPSAQDWFNSLPEATQLEVMGKTRLDMLKLGQVSWDDLSTVRPNPGWRDSHVVTPLSALKQRANI